MPTKTPTITKTEVRTRTHHAVIHRTGPACWTWVCLCGGGVHSTFTGLPTHREALIAGLVHVDQQPAA